MEFSAFTWSTVSKLLDEALDLEPAARAEWLDELTAAQPELAPSVRRLLAAHARSETADVLARLPTLSLHPEVARASTLAAGDRIGPYRLMRELGAGGMADVWLAERADGAFAREVALKLPMISRLRRDLAPRFARERDILARLEHPHIARLYDAGVTDDGLPYLAMEYVDGQPITDYCDTGRLDIDARLQLFQQVLDAVQYAHANLVIHRDLKPSNILVSETGQVRLLDFGIAKLLSGDDTAHETQLTQLSGRALTPDYASPEQIRGEPLTIASDIYSLGVVLYELLAGVRPYRLKVRSAAQLEQAIVDAEAAHLGSGIVAEAAVARSSTVARLQRALRGDLDTVVRKALAKQRSHRYLTVSEFADDLMRYGGGRTVRARPPSRRYRIAKYLVRNRLLVGAATAAVIALVVGAVVSLWQANIAREQAVVARQQARVALQESQRATAVQNFLLDIFRANSGRQENPIKARSTTAREMLDLGAERVESALKDAPEARLEVMRTLADMYDQLQLYEQEAGIERRRIALIRQLRGPDDPQLAEALVSYADALGVSSGGRDEIMPALEEAQRILDAAGDQTSAVRGQLMLGFARRYWVTSADKTKSFADEGVRIMRAHGTRDYITALSLAARARTRLNEDADAVPLYREAIGLIGKDVPVAWLTLAQNRGFLAESLAKLQRYDEALIEYRIGIAEARANLGPSQPSALFAQSRLARVLHRVGQRREGREQHEAAVEGLLKLKGPDDTVFVPTARFDHGLSLFAEGRLQESLEYVRLANASTRKHYQGSSILGSWLLIEGRILAALGRYDEAAMVFDEAWVHWNKGLGAAARPHDHNAFYLARAHLSIVRNDSAGAIEWLDRYVAPPSRAPLANDDVQRDLLLSQARLLQGNAEEALMLASRSHVAVIESPVRAYFGALENEASTQLARVLLVQNRCEAARPHIERALAWLRANDAPVSPTLADAEVLYGRCMLLLGDIQGARAAARRAAAIHAAQTEIGDHYVRPLRALQQSARAR